MRRSTPTSTARPAPARRRPASHGFSYIEMLVAVVLVGVAVIAILVGLRATVTAGRVGTERSQLLMWVQEGAEALHRTPYAPCVPPPPPATAMAGGDADAVRAHYQAALDAVPPPPAMSGGTLTVDRPAYLSIDPATFTERWDEYECDLDFDVALLRVTATSPDGTAVDLEVIVNA